MKALLENLFRTYWKEICMYFYGLCHDVNLSEDLSGEVFLEAVKSIPSFHGNSSVRTWLYAIARNRWYLYLRKKKTQIQTYSLNDLLQEPMVPSADEYPYIQEWIEQIISQQNPTVQKVFHMRMDGYSFYEISVASGISENSARVIWHRMKTQLQQQYRKEEAYEQDSM